MRDQEMNERPTKTQNDRRDEMNERPTKTQNGTRDQEINE
jgi:hypothetical protein